MEKPNDDNKALFQSLHILTSRWREGTFGEILDDWRWIFGYSKRYKAAILFYTLLGVFSTTFGLVASVAGKYVIDIITGYETSKLGTMIAVMLGSALFSLAFSNLINRISTKLSIDINNDIQADIFDQIINVDWKALGLEADEPVLSEKDANAPLLKDSDCNFVY